MNHKIRSVGAFLVLIVLALAHPSPKVQRASFERELNLRPPDAMVCLTEALPEDASLWFLTNGDGGADLDYYAQRYVDLTFFLAPRIVLAQRYNADAARPDWSVAYKVEPAALDQYARQNHATAVKTCGFYTLLHREK